VRAQVAELRDLVLNQRPSAQATDARARAAAAARVSALPTFARAGLPLRPLLGQPLAAEHAGASRADAAAATRVQAAARGCVVRARCAVARRWAAAAGRVQAVWRGRRARAQLAASAAALRLRLARAEAAVGTLRAELAGERLLRQIQDEALRLLWAQLASARGDVSPATSRGGRVEDSF
jgi:hypothetical protein